MSTNIIYCYSGSGNCLFLAKTIASQLGDTDIVMMRTKPVLTDTTGAKRVGFIFPCYAGGLPGNVEEYFKEIKIEPDTYTFGIVSYAGYPGVGLARLNIYHKLDYFTGVSHHCSCIWLMPHKLTIPPLSVEDSQKRGEEMMLKAAADIKAFKLMYKKPSNPTVNKIESAAWPKLSAIKAKKFNVSDDCVACGLCEKLCPKGNITVKNGKAEIGTNCIGCLSCLQYCPKEAINIGSLTRHRERYHNPAVKPEELMQEIIHID